jgi:hypothetical protein
VVEIIDGRRVDHNVDHMSVFGSRIEARTTITGDATRATIGKIVAHPSTKPVRRRTK